ncbi:hypothetical protein N2152v2_000087 [Parachlorella kessleri]
MPQQSGASLEATGRGSPFSRLSPTLIERCLLPLDLKDRVRCMLVNRKIWEIGKEGTLLWESVGCKPESTQSMSGVLDWIIVHHHQVRRLSLRPSEGLVPAALLPLWGMMTSAFAMLASSLVSLDFSMPCKVELAGWIAPLTSLAWLSVSAPLIIVNADMQHLKLLRTLELSTSPAEDATQETILFDGLKSIPGGSPGRAGLAALVLDDMVLEELPPTLTHAAASLTRLRLDVNYSEDFGREGRLPGSISGLAPLTALTALQVLEFQHFNSEAIPQEISDFASYPPSNLRALSGLVRLALLNMQYCQLSAIDASLYQLDGLRTLCLSGNPSLTLPRDCAWLGRLVELDIDMEAAVVNAATISHMESLERLCLIGYNSHSHCPAPEPASIVRLIQTLRRLPALRALYFNNGGQQLLTQSMDAMVAFADFLQRRPGVRLQVAPREVGNPFDGSWLTWDSVKAGEG